MTGQGTPDALLSITVPGGSSHDAWTTNHSNRLMQSAPDDPNMVIEIKMESALAGSFQAQGILIEESANNWMRFDIVSNNSEHKVFAATIVSSSPTTEVENKIGDASSPDPMWLRVTRNGNSWTFEYSTDGSTWTEPPGSPFNHTLTVNQVGIFGANAGGASAPGLTAVFDYFFNASDPISPEDTP